MLVFASWVVLCFGVLLSVWYFWIRSRGALRYWIRSYRQERKWLLGKNLPIDAPASVKQQLLTDVNAEVRSHEQRATTVVRQWDREKNTFFMGVALKQPLEGEISYGFECREWEPIHVVRLSGENRLDEKEPGEELDRYLLKHGLKVKREQPMRLSGQSFSLYQWEIQEEEVPLSQLSRFEEWTFQLRDNLVLPLVGLVVTLGLLGTRQALLFAAGVCFITFLSGACKFIFMHQRADEADEVHLQNY